MTGSISIGTFGLKTNILPASAATLTPWLGSIMTIYARSATDSFAMTYSRLGHHLATRALLLTQKGQAKISESAPIYYENVSTAAFDSRSMTPL